MPGTPAKPCTSLKDSPSDLPFPVDEVFRAGQLPETHGATGVELLSADADLRPKAELKAIGEAGGGIHVHCRRINFLLEAVGAQQILGDDGLGMPPYRGTAAAGL